MKKWIPNLITLLNLFCGCTAVIALMDRQYTTAFWLLVVAGVADFADGLVARLLGVAGDLGKEMDSLADMVTFGVVPGMIYYVLLFNYYNGEESPVFIDYYALPAFLVPLLSAVRLAKFNLDTRQTVDFIGLATPANTVFAAGIMLLYQSDAYGLGFLARQPVFLYAYVLVMSFLLISELRMFSFKFKSAGWAGNEVRWVFIAVALGLLAVLGGAAFCFIVLFYILLNVGLRLFGRKEEVVS